MSNDIFARCMAISMSHFLNTPYKEQTITEMYAPDGFANKASGICHYCTVDTLKEILNNGCLRFSDVRFLNDSTEFIEIIPLIENVLSCKEYTSDFMKLILESVEMEELKKYHQSYTGFSRITHKYEQKIYRTYTCSFSTENDSLSMWNYYASSGEGVSIAFNHSWDMFEGSDKSEVNIGEKLKNDIMIYRGLIVYKREDTRRGERWRIKEIFLKTLRAKLSYIRRKMDTQKLTLSLKMRPFGLHRHNYANYTKPVNPISASISNTFLKRENWKKIQLFGNSEQLLLMGKNIIQHIIILI